jgi:hypothetical protein
VLDSGNFGEKMIGVRGNQNALFSKRGSRIPCAFAVIRKIAAPCASTSLVTTFAGTMSTSGYAEGGAGVAQFGVFSNTMSRAGMMGFSVTPDGTIFVAVSMAAALLFRYIFPATISL